MSDYTPTTEEVREAISEWGWSRRMFCPELGQSDGREADRWLSEHDRQVAERAWDECIRAIEWSGRHGEDPLAYVYANSPYRAAKGEQK